MKFVVDSRLKRFVKGTQWDVNNCLSIYLSDIDETFYFSEKDKAQEFLTNQTRERFLDSSLRKGYFDYEDEYGATHRYTINEVSRGNILSFTEEIVQN